MLLIVTLCFHQSSSFHRNGKSFSGLDCFKTDSHVTKSMWDTWTVDRHGLGIPCWKLNSETLAGSIQIQTMALGESLEQFCKFHQQGKQ